MNEFYIHVCSKDSKDIYPQNTPADFQVQLPERLRFHGTWECALAEIEYIFPSPPITETMTTSLWVNTNVCNVSIVGNTKSPILRRVPLMQGTYDASFQLLHYYPVNMMSFDVIHLYINTDDGERASFLHGTLKATLHFRRAV